jgi:hypothetical protein
MSLQPRNHATLIQGPHNATQSTFGTASINSPVNK